MVQLPESFNPGTHKGVTDFEAVDPGWYSAQITKSQMKETASKNGFYLQLDWTIVDGPMANRKVFQRLNLVNPSNEAVEIAQKHLKSICDAMGVPGPIQDSEVLHEKPCKIRVTKSKATSQYPEGNDVKSYKAMDGNAQATGPVVAAAAAPAAPTTPEAPAEPEAGEKPKPPWVK